MILPKMTIEQREGEPHRVPPPDLSAENMSSQIQDALQLNDNAKQSGWRSSTLDILEKYIKPYVAGVDGDEIAEATNEVFDVIGFDEVVRWVQNDRCGESFQRMLTFCLKEGQKHKRSKDFIDGSGIGYERLYLNRLKPNLEKTFDAKWHYKVKRPLQYILDEYGMDLSAIANKVHPGHWSYCQGHATKSLTSVQVCREIFHADSQCSRKMLIAALAFGHGRDGSMIHYPMDTAASGYNTELIEFADVA